MIKQFKALGVSAPVVRALAARAIHAPFAIQQHVLPDALAGLDILAQSPTGSGKTLAFGIPLVERTEGASGKPAALVLVPTRELALQVADDLRPIAEAKRLRVATVYGGASVGSQARAARAANIVIATPGRMNDLLERRMIDLSRVRVLVLDEADRMLDMGFKPQVDRILQTVPRNRQTMLFSATLEGAVARARRELHEQRVRVQRNGAARARAGHGRAHLHGGDQRLEARRLIEQLNAGKRRTLVFVRTKHGADRLVQKLSRAEIRADGDAREPLAEPARARARPLHLGERADARRDRRRRPRARRRRHHPRDQLRPAPGRRGLRAPRRPHRPRGPRRHRDHVRPARAAGGRRPARVEARPRRPVHGSRADGREVEARKGQPHRRRRR